MFLTMKYKLKPTKQQRIRLEKTLSERIHSCECGLVMDRDTNAAVNIANKAVVGLASHKVIGCDELVVRNLNLEYIN